MFTVIISDLNTNNNIKKKDQSKKTNGKQQILCNGLCSDAEQIKLHKKKI